MGAPEPPKLLLLALDRAQVSAKVFSIYYDLPVAESTRGASSASA
eukprot:SAG11_NODE_13002_length_674_cov_2.417391_1_plen_44_part_10